MEVGLDGSAVVRLIGVDACVARGQRTAPEDAHTAQKTWGIITDTPTKLEPPIFQALRPEWSTKSSKSEAPVSSTSVYCLEYVDRSS